MSPWCWDKENTKQAVVSLSFSELDEMRHAAAVTLLEDRLITGRFGYLHNNVKRKYPSPSAAELLLMVDF